MGARSTQGRGPGLNKSDGHLLKYLRDSFTAGGGASITGTPSGGIGGDQVVDYNGYRIHVFKTTGNSTFTVNSPISAHVMAVGGGGGGTSMRGAGSGAGGCVLRDPGHPNGLLQFSPGSWTITVGAGGTGGNSGFDQTGDAQGQNGGNTIIDSESTLIAGGGGSGAGGWSGTSNVTAQSSPHGSGGGGGETSSTAGTGNSPSPAPIYSKGTPGGAGPAPNGGAGGGGWNAKGADGAGGDGGLGRQIPSIFRSPQITGVGAPGPNGEEWWVGGGGGGYGDTSGSGGGGGGGDGNGTGPVTTGPIAGKVGTGGGGGGAGQSNTGGTGGPGFVLIAYQIN